MRCTTFQTVCLLPAYVVPLSRQSSCSVSLSHRHPACHTGVPASLAARHRRRVPRFPIAAFPLYLFSSDQYVLSCLSALCVRYAPLGCVCVRVCSALIAEQRLGPVPAKLVRDSQQGLLQSGGAIVDPSTVSRNRLPKPHTRQMPAVGQT